MADWIAFESARDELPESARPSVTSASAPRSSASSSSLSAPSALSCSWTSISGIASSPAGVPSAASRSACRTYLRTAAARDTPGPPPPPRAGSASTSHRSSGRWSSQRPAMAPRTGARTARTSSKLARPPLVVTRSAGKSRASRSTSRGLSGGASRFQAGDAPASTATRACTTTCDAPAAATASTHRASRS